MNNELRRYIGKKVVDTEGCIYKVTLNKNHINLIDEEHEIFDLSFSQFLHDIKNKDVILITEEMEKSLKARDLINDQKINPESCKDIKDLQIKLNPPYTRVILNYNEKSNRVILHPFCYGVFGESEMTIREVDPSRFCNYINKGIFCKNFDKLIQDSVKTNEKKEEKVKEVHQHKRILILNTHPDDDVLAFGGLLARAKRNGDEVYMHTFCVGGPCSNVSTEVRIKELKEVSEFFGVSRSTYDDRELDGLLSTLPNSQITGIIDDLIKDLKPDEVYCSPYSEHVDHKALYEAFMGSARLKEGWMPKLFAVGCYPFSDQLYQTQVGGKIFQPMTEEDFNMKIEGFRKYKSQFKPSPSPLSDESLIHQSKYYGMLCGAPYAELYYQLRYIRSI